MICHGRASCREQAPHSAHTGDTRALPQRVQHPPEQQDSLSERDLSGACYISPSLPFLEPSERNLAGTCSFHVCRPSECAEIALAKARLFINVSGRSRQDQASLAGSYTSTLALKIALLLDSLSPPRAKIFPLHAAAAK